MHKKLPFPDAFLLSKIIKQHLYCDEKSKDPHINKAKRKYKLAGNRLLDHYFFHVLTTDQTACKSFCTLMICLDDWENKVSSFKLEDVGYCDLTKFESLDQIILLQKIKDINNGFTYVAKLSDSIYKKLLKLQKKLRYNPRISKDTIGFIQDGLSSTVDEIKTKLNL